MNILRLVLFVAVVFMYPGFLLASDTSTELAFPDLLSDDFLDDEKFDEFSEENEFVISDPFEPMNRFFFEFNDVVYVWALKPITDGYIWAVPRELRLTFANFFFNLAMPIRLLNALLQADFDWRVRARGDGHPFRRPDHDIIRCVTISVEIDGDTVVRCTCG